MKKALVLSSLLLFGVGSFGAYAESNLKQYNGAKFQCVGEKSNYYKASKCSSYSDLKITLSKKCTTLSWLRPNFAQECVQKDELTIKSSYSYLKEVQRAYLNININAESKTGKKGLEGAYDAAKKQALEACQKIGTSNQSDNSYGQSQYHRKAKDIKVLDLGIVKERVYPSHSYKNGKFTKVFRHLISVNVACGTR